MTTLDEFMAAIRTVESGSNYAHPKNASGASGAYQFIDSTWGNYGGYRSAYLAPPEVQDERARQLMQAYYDQFGDWDYVAAAWIGGPGTAAKGPSKWGGISDSNMSVSAYIARVNGVLGKGGSAGAAATPTKASGAGYAGVAGAAGVQAAKTSLGAGLSGALDVVGGVPDSAHPVYATTSAHGDTLGARLKAIMGIVEGGGPG